MSRAPLKHPSRPWQRIKSVIREVGPLVAIALVVIAVIAAFCYWSWHDNQDKRAVRWPHSNCLIHIHNDDTVLFKNCSKEHL